MGLREFKAKKDTDFRYQDYVIPRGVAQVEDASPLDQFNAEWAQTLSHTRQSGRFLAERDEQGRIKLVVDKDTGRVHTPWGCVE